MLRGSAAWSQAASPPAVSSQNPPICLNVSDHWDNLHTKNYSFTGILRSDALTLENLRELTACRAQAYENSSVTAEERLSWQVAFLREQGQGCLDHVSSSAHATLFHHRNSFQIWHRCIVWCIVTSCFSNLLTAGYSDTLLC